MSDGGHSLPAHRRLREATREAHDAAERAPVMRALMDDRLDRRGYAALLQAHLGLYTAWETAQAPWLRNAGWPFRSRREALRADLDALGADVSIRPAHAAFAAAPGSWGELYVVEGSALGGQLMARRLRARFPDLPHRFFGLGGDAHPASWRDFQTMLDQRLDRDDPLQAAIAAARSMFGHFQAMLERVAP